MSLRIVFTPNAWQDYDGWLRRDLKMARRISKLIIDVQRDPQGTGIGKPEMLKGPCPAGLPAASTTSTG